MEGNTKLYKYLDADGGLKMLQNSNLQFTNATRLNDPFDCHPSLFDFSNVPVNEYNWPPKEFFKRKGEIDMENLRDNAWICSLSKVHDSILMWAYYGNNKGICVGLDIEKTYGNLSSIYCDMKIGAIPMDVQYREVINRPDYFGNGNIDYLLSTKAKEWEHEQEVRLILLNPILLNETDRPGFAYKGLPDEFKDKNKSIDWKELRAYYRLDGACFDSLYLGVKIDNEKKEEIIKAARKCNPQIKIYQMTIDPEAFRLMEVPMITDLSSSAEYWSN